MSEIWQTTNLQPWVEALASGLITVKTRNSYPNVPVGAKVLLHASKARVWPYWRELNWTQGMNPSSWERGKIVAVATVEAVNWSNKLLKKDEYKYWDVKNGGNCWNCAACFAIRFADIVRLSTPIEAKGFQSPFVRAKIEVVEKLLSKNPEINL